MELLDEKDINLLNTDPYIVGSKLRKHSKFDYEYKNKRYNFKITACHPIAHNVSYLERDISNIDLLVPGTLLFCEAKNNGRNQIDLTH